jgi:peptidoglycan/LPS O-acetylase OafA/YrhL
MFGILRTVLALMVMCQHLLDLVPLGQYAVFCFYIISGYLMTLIMHETYGYSLKGRYYFAINRALRLYPMYWFVAGLTVLLILYIGQDITRNYNPSLYLPLSADGVYQNILMIFPSLDPIYVFPRFVPAAWALTVELVFYLLICLGISKTFNRVRFWFFLSLIYVVITYALRLEDDSRYSPIMAGSLPFSIGSAVYFYSRQTVKNGIFSKVKLSAAWLFVLLVINCFFGLFLFRLPNSYIFQELAFYTNLIISSLLVYKIAIGDNILALGERLDKFIGDFSYPIYLSHWQVGLLVSFFLFGRPLHKLSTRGVESFLISIVIVFMFSWLLITLIDKPVQKIRKKFKG